MEKIEIIIDNKTIDNFKNVDKDGNCFWNFEEEGIHLIKLIFNQNLKTCEEMF